MRFGKQIFLGVLIGLAGCVWLTFTRPSMHADLEHGPLLPTPVATVAAAPTSTPVTSAVAGQSSIKILLYGVTLTVSDPIEDLVYGEIKDGNGNTWAGFTTKTLLAKYPACKAGTLGTLVRAKAVVTPSATPTKTPLPGTSPSPTKTPTNQPFSKTLGAYTYSYRPSYSTCATDQAGRDALAAARAAVKNGALPTLSN
jgi:hypothetical protein